MEKISHTQVGQMMKTAAENLRALSEENVQLKEKVAHFEKRERAEKIASRMQEKGLEPSTTREQKVAVLLERDNLDVVEEAVELSASQEKLASVNEDENLGMSDLFTDDSDAAARQFAANIASLS